MKGKSVTKDAKNWQFEQARQLLEGCGFVKNENGEWVDGIEIKGEAD